jgi:hypothetical protein
LVPRQRSALRQPRWRGQTGGGDHLIGHKGSLCKAFHSDPLQSFAHIPQNGPSGLKCHGIQRAGRAARHQFQHVRVDHGG